MGGGVKKDRLKESNQLLGVVRKGYILDSPVIQVTSGVVGFHPGLGALLL